MLKRLMMVSVSLLATFALIHSVQAADDNGSLNSKDAKFVRTAATGGMLEVEIGQYVADKSSNSDVKMFGQHMVTDHGKANDELKALAASKNVDLKEANDKEQKEATKMKAKYDKLSGLELDKAYMKDMVKDHEDTVKEFEKAAEVTQDADLKTWAAKTLPTIQDHLKMAKDIEEKLEKTAG